MSDFEKYLSALKNLSDLIKTVDYSVEDINNFMEEVGEGYTETDKEKFKKKLNALKGQFAKLNKLMLSIYDFISKRKEEGIDIENISEGNKDKEYANKSYNQLLNKIVRDSYNSKFIHYEDSKIREDLTIPELFPEDFNYERRGGIFRIFFMKNQQNFDLPFFGETEYIPPNNTRLRARGKKLKRKPTKRKPTKRKPTKRKPTKRKPTKRKPTKRKPTKRKPTKRKPTKKRKKQTKKKSYK